MWFEKFLSKLFSLFVRTLNFFCTKLPYFRFIKETQKTQTPNNYTKLVYPKGIGLQPRSLLACSFFKYSHGP